MHENKNVKENESYLHHAQAQEERKKIAHKEVVHYGIRGNTLVIGDRMNTRVLANSFDAAIILIWMQRRK